MKVRFNDGREAEVKNLIAEKMIKKGKATAVKSTVAAKEPEKKIQRKAEE